MCCATEYKYSLNCISMMLVQFHVLCVTLHESDFPCGVTDGYRSTTNSVGLTREHN